MSHANGAGKPLSSLIKMAFHKFGSGGGHLLQAGDADVFILYANDVIREINHHPYTDFEPDIDYYGQEEERRDIPDLVLVKGMIFHLAVDQGSKRVGMYREDYYQTLNQWLYRRKFGDGPIVMKAVDREDESQW